MFPLVVSCMEDILEDYSALPRLALQKKGKSSQGVNGEELDINLGCHQVYPWCITTPPQWYHEGGCYWDTCTGKRWVNSGQGRKLGWKMGFHSHLEQGGTPLAGKKPWHWAPHFSLLKVEANNSRTNLLKCILDKLGWVWTPEPKNSLICRLSLL